MRRYGRTEQGDIQYFYACISRLVQALEPGNNVHPRANGMLFSDVDFDHITEQTSRCDIEATMAMPHSDNQKKAALFTVWEKHNPAAKARLDQMALDFRAAMRKAIREKKTWAGVEEQFKATHRDRITGEFSVPRHEWQIPCAAMP